MNISFEDTPSNGAGTTLVIPDQVMQDVEETFKYLTENPGKVAVAVEDTAAELKAWFKYARAYCGRRPDGNLKLRRLPSKHLPENQARFVITVDIGYGDDTTDAG